MKRFPFAHRGTGMGREGGKPFGSRDGMGVHDFLAGRDGTGSWNESGTGRELGRVHSREINREHRREIGREHRRESVGNIAGNTVGKLVGNVVEIWLGAVRNRWKHDRERGLETTNG